MSKNKATFGQGIHALSLIQGKNKTLEELEEFFQSGLLSDILDADLKQIHRNDFREYIGLPRTGFKFSAYYNSELKSLFQKCGIKNFDERITRDNVPFVKLSNKSAEKVTGEIYTFVRNGIIVGLDEDGLHNRRYCLHQLSKRGVRGATLEELVSFHKFFPEESKNRKIFTPGSGTRIKSGASWYKDEENGVFDCMVYIEDGHLKLTDESAWTSYHILGVKE